jgi:hypothetical protein
MTPVATTVPKDDEETQVRSELDDVHAECAACWRWRRGGGTSSSRIVVELWARGSSRQGREKRSGAVIAPAAGVPPASIPARLCERPLRRA